MTKADIAGDGSMMIRNLDSFSRLKQQVSGSLNVAGMERLADLVQFPEGDIHYVASGRIVTGADGSVLRKLVLKIQGTLLLPGEEPDSAWSHELDIERIFVLVRSEADLPPLEDEPDDEDYLVADRELNLSELVEDEVLLDLPVSPSAEGGSGQAGPIDLIGEPGEAERKNPFAALAALKKQNH
jgi:uncharacterized protein